MSITRSININGHEILIRRLLNPAKRIIISNVCPSIPNQEIFQSLKNIDITPTSQISYIKAGINLEGYEYILSFFRPMYINHKDILKLPESITINHNQSQFRIFFTDDTINCYTCKTTGHKTQSCKKNYLNNLENTPTPSKQPQNNRDETTQITQPDHSQQLESQPLQEPTIPMDWNINEEHQSDISLQKFKLGNNANTSSTYKPE